MADPAMIAAFAMRKLQALHLLATPGRAHEHRRGRDDRAGPHARAAAGAGDALARRGRARPTGTPRSRGSPTRGDVAAPDAIDAVDPETERFEVLHSALHVAVQAVVELSDGEIVYLE